MAIVPRFPSPCPWSQCSSLEHFEDAGWAPSRLSPRRAGPRPLSPSRTDLEVGGLETWSPKGTFEKCTPSSPLHVCAL